MPNWNLCGFECGSGLQIVAWTERSVNYPKRDTWGIPKRPVKLSSVSKQECDNIARALRSSLHCNYLWAQSAFKSPEEDKVATSISNVERRNLSWRRDSTRPQRVQESANINDRTWQWKVMDVPRTIKYFDNFQKQLTKKNFQLKKILVG